MPEPSQFRGASTRVFSAALVVIGIVLVVRTIVAGGSAVASGVILGVLFIAAGAGRMYLQLRG
jgi:hypothetical protein